MLSYTSTLTSQVLSESIDNSINGNNLYDLGTDANNKIIQIL